MATTPDTPFTPERLEAERLKLERESLDLERERLTAQRIYAEAEAKLARARRPASFFLAAALTIVLAFVGGIVTGYAYSENQRDRRLKETLSQLDQLGNDETAETNATPSRVPLSVTVIQ